MLIDEHIFRTGTFARFHEDTRYHDVVDSSGNAVPKFIIWTKYGDSPTDIAQIVEGTHSSYRLIENAERRYNALKSLGLLRNEA